MIKFVRGFRRGATKCYEAIRIAENGSTHISFYTEDRLPKTVTTFMESHPSYVQADPLHKRVETIWG